MNHFNDNEICVVITAGGKGTRITSIANDIPKPMIKINDKPLLEYQLLSLRQQGFHEITIIIGHLGDVIIDYFCDGLNLGMKIKYIIEEQPLGTAGGLALLENNNEDVLFINGDIMCDVDFKRMIDFHYNKKADITLFTHPNQHPYDSALIETNLDGRVLNWVNKEDRRQDYKNRVNAGIHILGSKILENIRGFGENKKIDLDRDVIKPNIRRYNIYAYDSPEYVKDMGTPERYYQVQSDYIKGIVCAKNLGKKQGAVFLDRDGTINKFVGFITKPDQIELIDGAAEAIKSINRSGYLTILVTNQPVIARGECTEEGLTMIHNRLERLLGERGAYLDDIIYCPHHPDKGFVGEIPELKIDCACRKPKPGMLLKMTEKYNIDLSNSYMIGDDIRDVQAGIAAGCKAVYIGGKKEVIREAEMSFNSLFDAVKFLFSEV